MAREEFDVSQSLSALEALGQEPLDEEELEKKRGREVRVLAEFDALLMGREVQVRISADSRSYQLQVGTRAPTYHRTLAQLMKQVGDESLRQALLAHGLVDLAKLEKGLQKLCERIGSQLHYSYEGFPLAQRVWAPSLNASKSSVKEAIQVYCDEVKEGQPSEWLEWLRGLAQHVEARGHRLCVLPLSPSDAQVYRGDKQQRREEARHQAMLERKAGR